MAASLVVKHLYDGAISASDGTGAPVTLSIPFTMGDQSRGVLTAVRKAARTYPSGSFSFQVADYSDAIDQTAIDYFLKSNSYSANISTLAAGADADVYTVDLVLTVGGTAVGDTADHTVTLTDCDVTLDVSEGEPNSASISFTCYGAVTFV